MNTRKILIIAAVIGLLLLSGCVATPYYGGSGARATIVPLLKVMVINLMRLMGTEVFRATACRITLSADVSISTAAINTASAGTGIGAGTNTPVVTAEGMEGVIDADGAIYWRSLRIPAALH